MNVPGTSVLIREVRLADGSGSEPYLGALRFARGRIEAIGRELSSLPGERVVEGGGLLLAPGFIDTHGHSDLSLPAAPVAVGKISQGVTTEVAGNCGLSPFPVTERNREHLNELYRPYGIPIDWDGYAGYRRILTSSGAKLKLLSFCGHNTLRAAVAGYEAKALSSAQLSEMCVLLGRELAAGAAGLSLGLIYTPGCFASFEEVVRLLEVVAAAGKLFSIHLRSEGNELLQSLTETFEAARQAGQRRVLISHFKTAGQPNWSKLDASLELIADYRDKGLDIFFDRYPYIESMTQLSIVAPGEFSRLNDSVLQQRLQDPAEFQRLVAALEHCGRDWSTVRLAASQAPEYAAYAGRPIPEIAADLKLSPAELVAAILRRDALGANGAFRGMSETNLIRILADRFCCCGSDESARPVSYEFGRSHPRGFGSFPRFFRILKSAGLPEGEIIRKMTALPADIFDLADRGRLQAGLAADLVLLDPDYFDSEADFRDPHQPATGVAQVWVNGEECL